MVASQTCYTGSNQVPSSIISSEFLQGTYLSTGDPIPCAGLVKEWHYCYSTASLTARSTYLMAVGVWTFSSYDYVPLTESIMGITETPIATVIPQTICKSRSISAGFMVSEGDIIGVVYSFSNASSLPVVTRDASGRDSLVVTSLNKNPEARISSHDTIPLPNTSLSLQVTISKLFHCDINFYLAAMGDIVCISMLLYKIRTLVQPSPCPYPRS